MATSLHAHVAREAADCDGRHGQEYIVTLNDEERAEHIAANGVNDFHDLNFKTRILGNVVSFHADATVRITPSGYAYSEATEEGYVFTEVTWCEDEDCDPSSGSQYDQYAELSGY